MAHVLLIALGAAVGANMRYFLSTWAAHQWGAAFPYGTLLVNLLGSIAIGALLTFSATRMALSEPVRLLLVTGLLGGFTTFSSFSMEAYTLLVNGQTGAAGLYLLASVGLGLLGVVVGGAAVRLVFA